MQARVKDILFEGIRITCDVKTHKQLRLICNVLKTNRPPTLRNTPEEGVYYFSFFHKVSLLCMHTIKICQIKNPIH